MPYIIVKRSDIPQGLLQTLTLIPNESLRLPPYQPYGQTGYRNDVINNLPVVAAGVVTDEVDGLAGWFLTNVSSGSGLPSLGQITTDPVAQFLDGDTLIISDGTTVKTFVFKVTAAYAVAAPNVTISLVGLVTNNDVRDAIIAAVNAQTPFNITAAIVGAGVLSLTNTDENIPAVLRNIAIGGTGPSVPLAWAVVGMAGGTNSTAMTPAQAYQDANDILVILGYDIPAPAAALDATSINAALTTGQVTDDQVYDILNILSGRLYTVPAGTVVESGGVFQNPGTTAWLTPNYRHIYDTGALRISWGEGELSKARVNTFFYNNLAQAAVAVYNDDGTLYTLPL